MSSDTIESVAEVLGKPVAGELSDTAMKVRRNLLAFGLVSVLVALGEVQFDAESTVLGFKFVGITDTLVRNALLAMNSYFLAHFAWYAFDGILEWRLRVTGTRLVFLTGSRFGSEHADYPDDPRQSTLYTWWLSSANRIGNFRTTIEDLSVKIKIWEEQVSSLMEGNDSLNLANAMSSLSQTQVVLDKLNHQISETEKTLTALRIPCSLKRFDTWFKLFLKSQNARWILIDVLTPIAIGILAIYLLVTKHIS